MTSKRTILKFSLRHLMPGISILFLAAFPAMAPAQDDPEPAQTPASVFSGIKDQFIKDIKAVRNVAKKEGKDISERTKTESEEFRDTITGMKNGVVLDSPGTVLSDP